MSCLRVAEHTSIEMVPVFISDRKDESVDGASEPKRVVHVPKAEPITGRSHMENVPLSNGCLAPLTCDFVHLSGNPAWPALMQEGVSRNNNASTSWTGTSRNANKNAQEMLSLSDPGKDQ
ncbi:hypothetical protein KCU65_g59, partial [Aureobasidium melanogenum]